MSKYSLTIESESNVTNGFTREAMDVTNINEGANVTGSILNKLGTSIPTPFARLHLFSSAFRELVENNIVDQDNNYLKLVSMALDMLEFMYLNGSSDALKIVEWNVNHQCMLLSQSADTKHQRFGEALKAAWDNGGYAGRNIYMIKYDDEYIGGTSPLSLFFTSPNLTGTYPSLSKGHNLFSSDNALDLLDRTPEFRLYVYKLFTLNADILQHLSFYRYVQRRMEIDENKNNVINTEMSQFRAIKNYNHKLNAFSNPAQGGQPLVKIMLSGALPWSFSVNGANGKNIDFFVKDLSNITFRTGYKIAATRDHYKQYKANGVSKSMRTPLVLNEEGINAPYIDTQYWLKGTLPLTDRIVPVYDRKLPNTEIKYPYVMASDFLQDKIIQVSYGIQKRKFHTGLEEATNFLLPLKREFFKYFGPEDIKGKLIFKSEVDNNGKLIKLTVRLMIPLEGGGVIPLEKEYKMEDGNIVIAEEEKNTFNLGFFPFHYDTDPKAMNHYKVIGAHTTAGFSLNFADTSMPDYTFMPEVTQADGSKTGEVSVAVRSDKDRNALISTIHYDVNRKFDLVEVNVRVGDITGQGLVLPMMRRLTNTANVTKEYTFGVDFGTTNTHVACFVAGAGGANAEIPALNIGVGGEPDETQMVYLNDHDIDVNGLHLVDSGFGSFTDMKHVASREFVRPTQSAKSLPMRTAVCEVDNLGTVTNPKLFSSLNIGFNYSNEFELTNGNNVYKTEIKWKSHDINAKVRMRIYFEQLLWMMRNKAVLNNGKPDINVVVTYPQAMDGGEEFEFKKAWRMAAENVGINPEKIDFQLESIAPYYAFLRSDPALNGPGAYVNMDIGGGSTDILYCDAKSNGEKVSLSVKFAADDIWGDGCAPMFSGGNNGFIQVYDKSPEYANFQHYENNKNENDEQTLNYDTVRNTNNKSVEIINYLFNYDTKVKFTDAIKFHKIALVPILHFSALMYYLAHFVDAFDLAIPKKLSFTGMGSTYIKNLGDDTNIAKLANAIINHATQNRDSAMRVIFSKNPKTVTANGAVMTQHTKQFNTELIRPSREICYGVSDEVADETRISIGDIRNNKVKRHVMAIYERIIDMLENDQSVRDILISMGYRDALNAKPGNEEIIELLSESFDSYQDKKYLAEHTSDKDETPVRESLFFWPLKDGLFNLGLILAD